MRGSTAGFTDTLPFSSAPRTDSALLELADIVFASVVVTPVVVVYWQSTWSLLDLYILPEDPAASAAWTAAVGLCLNILLCVFQSQIREFISPDKGRWTYYALSRLYSGVAGFACVCAVRGVWNYINECSEDSVTSLVATTVAATSLLAALRLLKNICASPFVVVIDSPHDHFEVPTYFRKSSEDPLLYTLDCILSVAVVGLLVVLMWRGLWALADVCFYPDDYLLSALLSLIVGYGLTVAIFASQVPLRWAAARLQGAPLVLLADINNFLSFVATINVWRGFWVLLDDYLFLDTEISSWWLHVISVVVLMMLNCFNTVLMRGVYFDDEEPVDECVVFPCHYVRVHFRRRWLKKKHRSASVGPVNSKPEDSTVPLQTDVK